MWLSLLRSKCGRRKDETAGDERICRLCCCRKKPGEFDRDHVIPQLLGTFEPVNPYVTVNCKECNNWFGRTLENKFATDSAEGFGRYGHGIKKWSKYRSAGRNAASKHIATDGEFAGFELDLQPDMQGQPTMALVRPQVKFIAPDSKWQTFRLHELPSRDELDGLGFVVGTQVQARFTNEKEREEIGAALQELGFDSGSPDWKRPEGGAVKVEQWFPLGERVARVISKIAFNYVTWIDEGLTLGRQFDPIRAFIRHGHGNMNTFLSVLVPQPVAEIAEKQGHLLAVAMNEDNVQVQVCLFNNVRYFVRLSTSGVDRVLSNSHFFDVEKRRMVSLETEEIWRNMDLAVRPSS